MNIPKISLYYGFSLELVLISIPARNYNGVVGIWKKSYPLSPLNTSTWKVSFQLDLCLYPVHENCLACILYLFLRFFVCGHFGIMEKCSFGENNAILVWICHHNYIIFFVYFSKCILIHTCSPHHIPLTIKYFSYFYKY